MRPANCSCFEWKRSDVVQLGVPLLDASAALPARHIDKTIGMLNVGAGIVSCQCRAIGVFECSVLPSIMAQDPVQPTATVLMNTLPVGRQAAAASITIGTNRGHEQSSACEPTPRTGRTAPASGLDHAGEEATTRRGRVLPCRRSQSPES
ncbi:hypothetical protein CSOJ01_04521 [Colletotrichum sojae]|uniref:Uncharacterized protein n=1 Tax=Colletotrichum sojae TaxID=2175907 RepID=A0A8H6JIM0_9PEZI|nr:hypothetical protein CSOJ01_04521 [Colletotrichum sojae]